ncbi:MAG: DUF2207 domain-containing protein [bacterium]|nr:DUF2207 domain-containing protein [bacterium]
MTLPKQLISTYFLLIAAFCFFLFPDIAEAKSWSIPEWRSEIQIQPDASIIVREERTFEFEGQFTWVESEILKQRVDDIVDVVIFDENENQLSAPEAEITNYTDRVHIRLNFSAQDETKTWVIQYTVIGGIGFFEDHDELYWNVVPLEHEAPIGRVQAAVRLPEPAEALSTYPQTVYRGSYGSTDQVEIQGFPDDKTIIFTGENILSNEGFTIVSSWPKDIVADPGTLRIEAQVDGKRAEGVPIFFNGDDTGFVTPHAFQLSSKEAITYLITVQRLGHSAEAQELTIRPGQTESYMFTLTPAWWWKVAGIVLGLLAVLVWILPIWGFWKYYTHWRKLGRDPQTKKTIIAQYEPPKGMRPSEMGTVVDERVQIKDITPMIVDFAVRGALRIEEIKKQSLLKKTEDYKLIRLGEAGPDWREYERQMFDEIFGKKSEARLSDLRADFYKKIPTLQQSIYEAVVHEGYFDRQPDKVRREYALKPILILVFGFAGLILGGALWPVATVLFLPIIFTGVIGLLFSLVMPKKTEKGAEAEWWIAGFKEYLSTAERFRLAAMTPETFEKFLPFAMVLGVEKQWARRFENIYTKPPSWYVGTRQAAGAFAVTNFAAQLSGFTAATSSSLSHSPSSSSSGFSGGSSGGGGGGGSVSAG